MLTLAPVSTTKVTGESLTKMVTLRVHGDAGIFTGNTESSVDIKGDIVFMRIGIRSLPYRVGLANSVKVVLFKAVPTLLSPGGSQRVCCRISTVVTSLSAIFI